MIETPIFTDHDGTLTDSIQELSVYTELVIAYNASTLGLSFSQSEQLLNTAIAHIKEHSNDYGWTWGEEQLIVAPATSDCYILCRVATNLVLEYLSQSDPLMHSKIEQYGGKEKYLDDLFTLCAPKLGVYYRPEAREFLQGLSGVSNNMWAVVTNSNPSKVVQKLHSLDLGFDPRVIGQAEKYKIDRNWTGLLPKGPYHGFEGYPSRGIELQRKKFHDVLHDEAGDSISRTIFVEDVGEFIAWLDYLCEHNPDWVDTRTALVLTPLTPEWERKRYSGTNEKRFGSDSLLDILGWITSMFDRKK
jgi:hypothetical protein